MTKPNTHATPWYLQLVQAFAAWLAAIFMLAFVVSVFDFDFDSTLQLGFSGSGLLVLAAVLQKQNTEVFANHMALAFVLCGQWLIFMGFNHSLDQSPALFFAGWALLQALLLWVFNEKTTRFVLCLMLIQALLMNASLYGIQDLFYWLLLAFCSWALLKAPSYNQHSQLLAALGLAGLLLLLGQSLLFASFTRLWWQLYPEPLVGWVLWPWLSDVFFAMWLVFFTQLLFPVNNLQTSTKAKVLAFLVVLLLAALYYFLPQAMLALAVLLLAFACALRVLQLIAVAALLFFISQYYYYLPESLLVKSWALLQLGLLLLASSALLTLFTKREANHEES